MKILICPDSFKGSASAQLAADAIHAGCKKVYPNATYITVPLADGGEGSAAILAKAWNWQVLAESLSTASISVFTNDEKTEAVFDMSALCGIDQLENGLVSSLDLNTSAIGALLISLKVNGFRKVFVCLGGSGTCDAGIGMADALGYKFLDEKNETIQPIPRNFADIKRIEKPQEALLNGLEIQALFDVNASLFGEGGSALGFGPQKGLSMPHIQKLDADLLHISQLAISSFGVNVSNIEGAGAAGGLGFGLMLFAKAKMHAGAPFIIDALNLEQHLKEADLVITGEGKIDRQTKQGKVISKVIDLGEKYEKPVFAICGSAENEETASELGLSGLIQIVGPDVDLSDAINRVDFHLTDCAYTLANYLSQHE